MFEIFTPGFIGQTVQTLIILVGGIMALGAAKQEIRNQANILTKLDGRVDKLESSFIQLARQDERMNAMDQRMLSQGRRIDQLQSFYYGRRKTKEETEGD